ncbi:chromosome segregation protein SMC [Solemya pervernicosa gill symbiont]|uniref:Chromosome partition protein Smc n=2 Tax=Gammaproteobacteria incertae sedis TaxID=118884 RepID=A0A1T2L1J7_9GAMM|nr:chromosome segregation protein SMC [Candidatus Reidiella endopervernicosa]OOZ38965.1 chromosome segregation protein SMC [Solemya pervernicosa gill symbiont]QKQ26598.1 chromosome segregation protein SMC [Candidatus Reidiella endopervernicosa]
MRLSKIKLAGFKSFVDPTSIQFPSNLTGIVGPNGCGKSNTIDAVRWVMGESSAKHLRGESMADVIFNGSSARKPVGQASVELIFDNSDGAAGGEYAKYNEISIRRAVSRDGQSAYSLNGTRCRRKDITGLFLGTGLGPRSYSIIEQGMISRVIEAKPEELRTYLEEAAGISKYKERRRETENRIKHTRENLDRLSDLREELEKQLDRLQRQSKTAERFKELKQDERLLKAELLALRWKELDVDGGGFERTIQEKETELEAVIAEQRSAESELEKLRGAHIEASDRFNEVQSTYYGLGADITRIEQSIQHGKERIQQQTHDLQQVEQAYSEAKSHINIDTRRLEELESSLETRQPELERAEAALEESAADLEQSEQAGHDWQGEWEDFNRRAAEPARAAEVERTRISQIESTLMQLEKRRSRAEDELQGLSGESLQTEIEQLIEESTILQSEVTARQQELEGVLERLQQTREQNNQDNNELHERRQRLQNISGRLTSLEALQEAALGKSEGVVTEWLQSAGFSEAPRLAQNIEVDSGWERAVETVLGQYLQAVCVDGFDAASDLLGELSSGSLTLFDTTVAAGAAEANAATPILNKVRAPWAVDSLLGGVYCVDDLAGAMALRANLAPHESVITRDGIWLGAGWLRVARDADEQAGVLQRESEIKELSSSIEEESSMVSQLEERIEAGREMRRTLEGRREDLQRQINQENRRHAEINGQVEARKGRLEQVRSRTEQLRGDIEELRGQTLQEEETLRGARTTMNEAVVQMEAHEQQREAMVRQRDRLREGLDAIRRRAQQDREAVHKLALQIESMNTAHTSTTENLVRMEAQLTQFSARRDELQQSLSGGSEPIQQLETDLEQKLSARSEVERKLSEARRGVEEIDESMRKVSESRSGVEQRVQTIRESLVQTRMQWQEITVRRRTLEEQVAETDFELDKLLEQLDAGAEASAWQQKVEEMERRIQRLGPINLAAIDEYKEQSERKVYLDAQNDDLVEALETLEGAMRKIDRETRTRFKETFDQVNSGIQRLFPRLFGGGHAYLELTGDDLLETGVTVMARPPGKRISNIHLLSGGEKALTAVSLVFAIFELNPAPFCMLDEVDAPLDEANVGRFCEMVKEMSEQVQFIFITHNKTTMELSNQLSGVTMHEPGVSRLVAVDVAEAIQLASA